MILKILFAFILVITLIGCTKEIYIPLETIRIEHQDKYIRDSIVRYDSVFV
jgi:hypothetical protein